MRWLTCFALLATSLAVAAEKPKPEPNPEAQIIEQGQPVYRWFKAVQTGDQELLKSVFSQRIRKAHDATGWDKMMKTYQEVFKKDFGDYKLADLRFTYSGKAGAINGTVSVRVNGKDHHGLRVINEKGDWKVDER